MLLVKLLKDLIHAEGRSLAGDVVDLHDLKVEADEIEKLKAHQVFKPLSADEVEFHLFKRQKVAEGADSKIEDPNPAGLAEETNNADSTDSTDSTDSAGKSGKGPKG